MLQFGWELDAYGKVVGITWIGERYYYFLKDNVVSLIPATVVEGE